MLPQPTLADLLRVWLLDTKSGLRIANAGLLGSGVYQIMPGLTDIILAWVHDDGIPQPFVYVVGNGLFRPEDPEFFSKLQVALGIQDGRTDASAVPD